MRGFPHSGCVEQNVYSRALVRAAELLGSTEALSAYLDVSLRRLERWMDGRERIPQDVFLKVVDLYAERQLEHLQDRQDMAKSDGRF